MNTPAIKKFEAQQRRYAQKQLQHKLSITCRNSCTGCSRSLENKHRKLTNCGQGRGDGQGNLPQGGRA